MAVGAQIVVDNVADAKRSGWGTSFCVLEWHRRWAESLASEDTEGGEAVVILSDVLVGIRLVQIHTFWASAYF